MPDDIRELMYASLERELSAVEQGLLEGALRESESLSAEYLEIKSLRESISSASDDISFSPFFADRVMDRIGALEGVVWGGLEYFRSLKSAFSRVAAGAALACLLLVFLNLRTVEQTEIPETAATNDLTTEEMFEQLSWLMLEEVL